MAEGDGSSRNFRSSYYEKLGFCGSEEKNILDLLLTSSPLDSEKLSDLSERFDLCRRCVEAWRLLLGVDCGRRNPFDDYENVRRVRAEHFQSLRHHLEILLRHNLVMKKRLNKYANIEYKISNQNENHIENHNHQSSIECDDQTENNADILSQQGKSADLIALMYLLEAGRLDSLDIDAQLNSPYCRKLSAIASFFVNVSNDLQEAFFLFRNFTRKLENNEGSVESNIKFNK